MDAKPRERSIRIQSIIYNSDPDKLVRSLQSVAKAADLAITAGIVSHISFLYGDCSPKVVICSEEVAKLKEQFKEHFHFSYQYFNQNLGSARGHNTLAENCNDDFLLIMNPDIILSPNTIIELLKPFDIDDSAIGIVEARQTPIEHPKEYNYKTGETSWASTACVLISHSAFKKVNGFDADTFFLYCDDVDFSWRVKLAEYKVIYQPSAVVFHDKLFTNEAELAIGPSERYYSAEAGLLMAYKWSNEKLLQDIIAYFETHDDNGINSKALAEFKKRQKEGSLPKQLDKEHKVAQFIDNGYAKHRFLI